MRFCFLVALLCLGLVHAAFADPPQNGNHTGAVSDESKFTFDGIWKPKGAMLSGVLIPPPALKAITLKINKNKYEVAVEGEDHSDIGTFTLDPTTTPKRMTINSTEGPNKGKMILAIYEIKNADAMRVCYDLSGTDFPKEFKAPKDSELYLVGYRRQVSETKKDDEKPAVTSRQP